MTFKDQRWNRYFDIHPPKRTQTSTFLQDLQRKAIFFIVCQEHYVKHLTTTCCAEQAHFVDIVVSISAAQFKIRGVKHC